MGQIRQLPLTREKYHGTDGKEELVWRRRREDERSRLLSTTETLIPREGGRRKRDGVFKAHEYLG